MTIVSVWGYPTNPHYNPDTANNCGDAADASIDAPEDVEAVCASINGVLGLDIMELIHEVAPVVDECARRQWQALNKGA